MSDAPIDVTSSTFKETVLDSSIPVLVDFWAAWCAPCLMMAPVLEELAREYQGRATIARLNVDENSELAAQYGVMSIPNMVLFKDGREVDRIVGVVPKRVLQERLDAALS